MASFLLRIQGMEPDARKKKKIIDMELTEDEWSAVEKLISLLDVSH